MSETEWDVVIPIESCAVAGAGSASARISAPAPAKIQRLNMSQLHDVRAAPRAPQTTGYEPESFAPSANSCRVRSATMTAPDRRRSSPTAELVIASEYRRRGRGLSNQGVVRRPGSIDRHLRAPQY